MLHATSLHNVCRSCRFCDTLLFINIFICDYLFENISKYIGTWERNNNTYIYMYVPTSVFPAAAKLLFKVFRFFFWSPSFEMRLTANKFRHFAELVRMRQCARLCNMRRKNVCFLYIYATLAAAKFYFCTQKCCVLSHSCHCCCYRCCCC